MNTAEVLKESIAVVTTKKCPDCGGDVEIKKAKAVEPYKYYWVCTSCWGEAGIADEALVEEER